MVESRAQRALFCKFYYGTLYMPPKTGVCLYRLEIKKGIIEFTNILFLNAVLHDGEQID